MHAGALAGTPVRIHTFTGQVWASRKGPVRRLLKAADRRTAKAATHVLADSTSQRDFLVTEGVVSPDGCEVIGQGSLTGIDVSRFRPDSAARASVRNELGLRETDLLVIFLGRINRDKGVIDLARAFARIDVPTKTVALVMVGVDEENLRAEIQALAADRTSMLRFVGYTQTAERYLAAADVLCLPSYREGMPTATLEAGACAVPVVASRIYGVADAVVDGKTGLLFEAGDVDELKHKLEALLCNAALRNRFGMAARERVCAYFDEDKMVSALQAYYRQALSKHRAK
jgi:glycosyltransferase involved in cell wall biosynthesis